jgi:hypothetical protein
MASAMASGVTAPRASPTGLGKWLSKRIAGGSWILHKTLAPGDRCEEAAIR